ncbi:MAG: bifunctional DNA primase/polymerase, partial [Tabrizicola sp.]
MPDINQNVNNPGPSGTTEAQALAMAARGFRLHPLRPGDKGATLSDWPKLATTDAAIIQRWFAADPGINFGVTGGSDLLILDLDCKPAAGDRPAIDGLAALAALEAVHGKLPETFTVATPGGGRHLYFRGPDVANSASRIGEGIDVKSAGGYVVGPGSHFADPGGRKGYTGHYRALEGDHAAARASDLPECPPWLVNLMQAPVPPRDRTAAGPQPYELDTPDNQARAVAYLLRAPEAIDGVNGNLTLFKVACQCRDLGVTQAVALDLAWEHYNPRCLGPWGSPEDATWLAPFASAYGGGAQNPMPGTKSAEAVAASFGATPLEAVEAPVARFPEPADLWADYPVPALPTGVLPRVIDDLAAIMGDQMGADPAGIAMAALGACAGAPSDDLKVKVKLHDNWTESARLWIALLGSVSALKSPVISLATRHLRHIERQLADAWAFEEQDRKTSFSPNALKQLAEHKTLQPLPPPRRLVMGDATVEAAQQVLSTTRHG